MNISLINIDINHRFRFSSEASPFCGHIFRSPLQSSWTWGWSVSHLGDDSCEDCWTHWMYQATQVLNRACRGTTLDMANYMICIDLCIDICIYMCIYIHVYIYMCIYIYTIVYSNDSDSSRYDSNGHREYHGLSGYHGKPWVKTRSILIQGTPLTVLHGYHKYTLY